MRKYFVYELKKNAFAIVCLTLIAVIVYLTPILCTGARNLAQFGPDVWISSIIGGVMATIIPIWIFSYKMKQRSVDLYYSLPLSHVGVLAVKFFVGLIALYVPYVLSYWLGAFVVMGKVSTVLCVIHTFYYLPQFFASLIPLFMIYATSAFMFTRANTLLDGIIFVLCWAMAAFFVALVLYDTVLDDVHPICYIYFYPLWYVSVFFDNLMKGKVNTTTPTLTLNIALGFTYMSLLAVGSVVGLFLLEKRGKAENAEQLSESLFGYRVMIPFYTVFTIAYFKIENDIYFYMFFIIIAIAMYIATAVYKRTIKIGKIQAVVYVCSVALGLLLSFLLRL